MTCDWLFDMPEFEHKPLRPPRKGHAGEHVYAEHWAVLMAQSDRGDEYANPRLVEILSSVGHRLTQRDATVAASLICWLGCNIGNCTIRSAQRIAEKRDQPYDGNNFLIAWTLENRRMTGVNGGIRTLEFMLAPEDHFGRLQFMGGYGLIQRPEISVQDIETAEHVAYWLGTGKGLNFIRIAEAEIDQRHKAINTAQSQSLKIRYAEMGAP